MKPVYQHHMFNAYDTQAQPITSHVLHSLYTEVMILADEARSYFERQYEGSSVAPELAVAFSCESLKVTTRLMHSIAWLLSEKAIFSGELTAREMLAHERALGFAPGSDPKLVQNLPAQAQYLVSESEVIYERLQRINAQMMQDREQNPPFHHIMLDRLQKAF